MEDINLGDALGAVFGPGRQVAPGIVAYGRGGPALEDCTECFAVPGQNSMIDMVRPGTNYSFISGETLEHIRKKHPTAERMSVAAWAAAKYERQNPPVTWAEVTEEQYMEALEVLPPAFMSGGAFMVGEPCDHCAKTGRARFQGYYTKGGKFWAASRPMTRAEFSDAMKAIFNPDKLP